MHWFGGSIVEAVTLSKQRNAIFVVFVEGDNDMSAEMAATIDDTAVVTRLSDQGNFLAVKLKSGSTNYMHFARMYQFVPVPSLFFIDRNGTPLEVVCAGVQPGNLAVRIDRILEEHSKDKPVQPSTSAQNVREQTVNFLQTESGLPVPAENKDKTSEKTAEKKAAEGEPDASAPPAKQAKTDVPYEVVCEGDVCMKKPKASDEPGPSQATIATTKVTPSASSTAPVADNAEEEQKPATQSVSTPNIEEKVGHAKELIEARRLEKADKEKEAEKQKEMDRRSQGKGVAELKRWQAEQELKQIQEERKREKMANNLARQRILEQIAQDRAERRARDSPATMEQPQPQQSTQPPATSGDSGGHARIQFKLPDGTSHTAHFDADGTLGEVQQYVSNNLNLATSSFSLWTAFPRRELSDAGAALRALQLAPSAALLVLPRRAAPLAAPRPAAGLLALFTQFFTLLILEPTHQLFAWLRSRLYPPPAASTRASGPSDPSNPSNPSDPQPPQPPQPGGNVRRRGNVHRLPSDRQNDDDNNTWNGNSTQQM